MAATRPPSARRVPTGARRMVIAHRLRNAAQAAESAHPALGTPRHLRDAAEALQRGSTEGAKRHLRAAMNLYQPVSLLRHGVLNDEGHTAGRQHLAAIHALHLQVQDVEDTEQGNLARRQFLAGAGPAGAQLSNVDLASARLVRAMQHQFNPGEPRDAEGRWTLVGNTGSGFEYEGPPGGFGHAQAMEARAHSVREVSDTAANAVRHATRMMIARRLDHARRHMDVAIKETRGTGSQRVMQAIKNSLDAVPAAAHPLPGPDPVDPEQVRRKLAKMKTRFGMVDPNAVIGASNTYDLVGPKGWEHGFRAVRPPATLVASRGMGAYLKAAARVQHGGVPSRAYMRGAAKMRMAAAVRAERERRARTPRAYMRGAAIQRMGRGHGLSSADLDAITLSARTAMLERTPAPRGRPGGPGLYDVKGMGHTPYLQQIVKALIEKRGMPPGKAYAIARGAIRKWMRGGGHVHPEVMAAAGKAEAGEVSRQARAKASHGHSNDGPGIELAYNPAEPRGRGGQWIREGARVVTEAGERGRVRAVRGNGLVHVALDSGGSRLYSQDELHRHDVEGAALRGLTTITGMVAATVPGRHSAGSRRRTGAYQRQPGQLLRTGTPGM